MQTVNRKVIVVARSTWRFIMVKGLFAASFDFRNDDDDVDDDNFNESFSYRWSVECV